MHSKLLQFHKKLSKEYNEYLESFNLLFYGYGCKKHLLNEIFPDSFVLNGLTDSITTLSSLILQEIGKSNIKDPLSHFNELLIKEKNYVTIIIHNFLLEKFDILKRYKSFKIIGTIEKINFTFSIEEINAFNFIFRDLTTMIPYNEEVSKFNTLQINKLKTIENIFINVQRQSQIVFIEVLKIYLKKKSVFMNDLIKNLKVKLMSSDRIKYFNLLVEFIDHKIIKIANDDAIQFKMSEPILSEFYEKYESFNKFT